MTNTRSQRTKDKEKTEKNTDKHLTTTRDTQQQKHNRGELLQPYEPNQDRRRTNQQLNLQKKLHRQRREDPQHKQGGKASTRPTNIGGKASARRELSPTTTAAKHPPKQHSGKASASIVQQQRTANRRPTRPRRCRGTKQRQAQKRILSEKSNRPSPARASKTTPTARERRKGAVVVRPTWSRFSPEKLTEEEVIGERVTPSTR